MTTHGWTGNVRALVKALREAMLLREEGWLRPDDLRIAGDESFRGFAEAGEGPARPAPVAGTLSANRRGEIALQMAHEQGTVSRRQLAARCSVSRETARADLGALVRLGRLRPVGKGSATSYVSAEGRPYGRNLDSAC
jgi:DNA-binding NtrC family response regulator